VSGGWSCRLAYSLLHPYICGTTLQLNILQGGLKNMARCSEKLQHTAHNRAKKSMSRFQKIRPWWTGKCASVLPMKNLTYFSSFCCLFLFSSFQDKNPLEEVTGLFTRQKGLFDCCFLVKFHWFHHHKNWNSLKNCSFISFSVMISSGTTREAFWLSGRKLRRFFGPRYIWLSSLKFFCCQFLYKTEQQLT